MDYINKALDALHQAEKAVAALIAEAGKAREYADAGQLVQLARELKELADRYVSGSSSASVAFSTVSIPYSTPRQKLGRVTYPQFLKSGGTLVKVGWSRSNKTEYEHKSPKRVLLTLTAAIADTAKRAKRFSMDDLLPLRDGPDGSALPDYQAYICLAMLRSANLLVQHGRQGYSISKGIGIEAAAEQAWAALPER
jgi:hypothetical protein